MTNCDVYAENIAIGKMDFTNAIQIAETFSLKGNKVTVEKIVGCSNQDQFRITIEGSDAELLRRQFNGSMTVSQEHKEASK